MRTVIFIIVAILLFGIGGFGIFGGLGEIAKGDSKDASAYGLVGFSSLALAYALWSNRKQKS